jgi:AP2 domain
MKDINGKNPSGYVGVSYDISRDKYKATIKHKGKLINVGRFDTAEEAAEARKNYINEHLKL